ncbi:MAG: DHH family phosphoesterase [Armatimonadota bacterium]|nr:DHH family phosphoesterase [Armatimonadota bacterium]MDR7532359.1 DHH family phosphoesterase [Armatimonadota bacterium]MDR7535286.1 DHH family phosphoesterase [Armatimonadota bacterium]
MTPRAAIAQVLARSARTLLVCHEAPDGDCLGSALALARALAVLGREALVASPEAVPSGLRVLPGAEHVVTAVPGAWQPDVAVTLECGTLARAGALAADVARAPMIIAIDHHAEHQPYADLTDWDPAAAAVGEQVTELIALLGVTLDAAMAQALLVAVTTDTGIFRYANTTPRVLRLAAELMERGADLAEIVRRVYEEQPVGAMRLLGAALASCQLHLGGAVAVAVVMPAMRAAAGPGADEAAGIAAALRTIAGVRLAVVLEEHVGGVRVSLRARDGVRADRVAAQLGGGGHAAAAGAQVRAPLDAVLQQVLAAAASEVGERRDAG